MRDGIWILSFVIVVLLALIVAIAAAWISRASGRTVPLSIRDGAVAFGSSLTLGVLVITGCGVLGGLPG